MGRSIEESGDLPQGYDKTMASVPQLNRTLLRPGQRLAVAVSGGADSVALLRTLVLAAPEIGFVLSVAHVHHGIRGADADADAEFVAVLAAENGLVFHRHDVDTPATAKINRETIEEAARNLRYEWFGQLLASGEADAVATAHTLDDQAETVLHKLLRGAWTEGLSGIHPVVMQPKGTILRPFLHTRRSEIEAWLRSLNQSWREDTTNADTAFTRNRLRHQLLPELATYNPQIHTQLAHLATVARDEEAYWQTELGRLLPTLLLPGKPVRGGGRASSTDPNEAVLALEIERLPSAPAVRRRILRAAARQLGVALNYEQTERLLAMCGASPTRRQTLTAELHAERSPRELRLVRKSSERTVG
jgi:tRNA(Ile)-lysidine synthase